MPTRFKERSVGSIAELLEVLKADQEALKKDYPTGGEPRIWYRGLPSKGMQLQPTLHRAGIDVADERHLMNRFKQNAYEFLEERPQGEWEWMLLARHHGLPSRLLDWTENPLVGLFFSCDEPPCEKWDPTGALWCLLPAKLNEVAKIDEDLPMFLDEAATSSPGESLDVYGTRSIASRASEVERPPAAAIGIRTSKRIQAQLGVFTIHHASKRPLEDWGDGTHVWRLVIPQESKESIREELRRLGVTSLSLFPDLDNVAKEASRSY